MREAVDWRWPGLASDISLLLVHQQPDADIGRAYGSAARQAAGDFGESVLIASTPPSDVPAGVEVRACDAGSLTRMLVDAMASATGSLVLLLDTGHALAEGALAELCYAVSVRSDVAAVGPRVMWDAWPSFVGRIGDWRDCEDVRRNPKGVLR